MEKVQKYDILSYINLVEKFNINKLYVKDIGGCVPSLKRTNKNMTLEDAMKILEKRREYFRENKAERRTTIINDDLTGFKRFSFHTFDNIQCLLEKLGFNDDNHHTTHKKRVDNLKPFKGIDHKYDLKIHFSYKVIKEICPYYQEDFDVYYNDIDEDENSFDIFLEERIYLDNELVRHYLVEPPDDHSTEQYLFITNEFRKGNWYVIINKYKQ